MYIPILLIGMIFNIIVSFLGSIYVAEKLTKEVAKNFVLGRYIKYINQYFIC